MAYHKGEWLSDRETRARNEKMWADHTKGGGGSGKPHGKPHDRASGGGGGKGDDLTRAMADDVKATTGGTGGTLAGALTHASAIYQGGTKLDRPTIPGGCTHNGTKVSIVLSSGKRLYGSRGMDLKKVGHLDLVIDCAGILGPRRKFVKSSTAPRYRALDAVAWPDVVTLAWPDMTAPSHVGVRFWQRLLTMLPQDTAVCCVGSHGRTGTAMAALLIADGMGSREAVARVRAEHCARAIETTEQVDYLHGLQVERDRLSKRDDGQGGK